MIAELDFVPLPADTSLFEENVQYIVIDRDNDYHVARWDGEQFLLDGSTTDADEGAEEAEDVDVVLIALLPVFELPTSL
jgi:hypothetical protein